MLFLNIFYRSSYCDSETDFLNIHHVLFRNAFKSRKRKYIGKNPDFLSYIPNYPSLWLCVQGSSSACHGSGFNSLWGRNFDFPRELIKIRTDVKIIQNFKAG